MPCSTNLPRAPHWLQNGSLRHYPTARIAQDIRPYWAEAVILHLRRLWGNDRPVNLVQWFSMLGSIAAATGIARLLGGRRKGAWLTAPFALTIPMGVLQASIAQNDYAATLWVLSLAYFVVLSRQRALQAVELAALAFALGVGMLTKGTIFPFAASLMAWYFLGRLRQAGLRRVVAEGLLIGAIAIALNSGFWWRNIKSYGGLYGDQIPVGVQTNVLAQADFVAASPGQESTEPGSSADAVISIARGVQNDHLEEQTNPKGFQRILAGINAWLVSVLQMVAMNFVTPVRWINQRYFEPL